MNFTKKEKNYSDRNPEVKATIKRTAQCEDTQILQGTGKSIIIMKTPSPRQETEDLWKSIWSNAR